MKEFWSILLGTLSGVQFSAILFIACLTAFTMFLIGTTKRDPNSISSPIKFSWSYFLSDEIKGLVSSFLLIILSIRFSQKWIDPENNALAGFLIGLISKKLASIFIIIQEFVSDMVKDKFPAKK